MPLRPAKACASPNCPELVFRGSRCPRHEAEARARQRTQAQRYNRARGSSSVQGYGPGWRGKAGMRAQVLREQPLCACGQPAVLVDHILPIRQGGSHDRQNLQALCAGCHAAKTAAEAR